MKPSLAKLREQIYRYMAEQSTAPGFSSLVMPDVADSALRCQRRIEALGYEWDRKRMLWRLERER